MPAVAVKVAVVEPASTVTEIGVVRSTLLLDSATTAPPAGAALESVTVQVVPPPDPRMVGLHANADTSTGATRLTVALWDWPFNLAITVAFRSVGKVRVVALNVAEVDPAATVMLAGVLSVTLLEALNETVLLA